MAARSCCCSTAARSGEEGWLLKYPQEGSSGVRRIEPALKTYAGTPTSAWMPDNRHVVMSLQPTPYGSEQLWLVDTQSSERHALTSSTRNAFDPSVAPGGDKLVFRETNGNFDVVSVDLATGAATALVATERNEVDAGVGRRRARDGLRRQPQRP